MLNAVRINASDPHPPKKVHLPTLSDLAHTVRRSKSGRWLCKIDLTSCYWSIRLPRSWHRVFVVEVSGRRYKYTRLPFGWKHSPALCQTLIRRIVHSAIFAARLPVGHKVYLDDILLDARRRHTLRAGRRAVVRKLRQAGFLISVKSELRPTKRLVWVGKLLDTLRKRVENQSAVLAGAFRMWLRGVGTGLMSAADLSRLLGRIPWLARPGSLSCFLAGAYRCVYAGTGLFTRGLVRSLGTALLFCLVPQSFKKQPASVGRVFFVDVAPPLVGSKCFTVGIVSNKGCLRTRRCPVWVTSMPQAELYAIYVASKIAAYEGHLSICVGSDSDTARL